MGLAIKSQSEARPIGLLKIKVARYTFQDIRIAK